MYLETCTKLHNFKELGAITCVPFSVFLHTYLKAGHPDLPPCQSSSIRQCLLSLALALSPVMRQSILSHIGQVPQQPRRQRWSAVYGHWKKNLFCQFAHVQTHTDIGTHTHAHTPIAPTWFFSVTDPFCTSSARRRASSRFIADPLLHDKDSLGCTHCYLVTLHTDRYYSHRFNSSPILSPYNYTSHAQQFAMYLHAAGPGWSSTKCVLAYDVHPHTAWHGRYVSAQ